MLLIALAPVIEVIEILLFQRLVDEVLTPIDFGPLPALALLYIALNITSGIVSGLDDYLGTWISQKFMVRLRADVFGHVLSLPSHVQDRRRLPGGAGVQRGGGHDPPSSFPSHAPRVLCGGAAPDADRVS